MVVAVVMAGGKGERFWPKSRARLPKQLLDFTGQGTMIQQTVERVQKIIPYERVYIVTGREYAEPISRQLPALPAGNILVEPMGRNTAPCIGLASLYIEEVDPEAVMVVLAADHLIRDKGRFLEVLEAGTKMGEKDDHVVTIGITPTHPETGYGYIKYADEYSRVNGKSIYRVEKFTEKPNLETARQFIASGSYLWNSGMFIWKVSTIRALIKQHMPKLHEGLERIKSALGTAFEQEVLEEEYARFDKISIDFGVMEHAKDVFVIPGDFGWDDLGSWPALSRVRGVDKNGNVIIGRQVGIDTKDCIIESPKKVVATIGLDNLIIVETDDVLMVCSKDRAQDVKEILQRLREEGLQECI